VEADAASSLVFAAKTGEDVVAASKIAGGCIQIKQASSIKVEKQAAVTLTGPTVIASHIGAEANTKLAADTQAQVQVAGAFISQARVHCAVPMTVSGELDVNAGHATQFHSIKLEDTSKVTVRASAAGFVAGKVDGKVAVSGSLTVDTGSYLPTERVVLMECGSLSGSFSSVTVLHAGTRVQKVSGSKLGLFGTDDSNNLSGHIIYEDNKIIFDPKGLEMGVHRGSAAAVVPSVLLSALLALVATLFF
jgi:hypothetical protein